MMTDDELEQFRFKGEGADLDFKQAQYPFVDASDHQKSELLKDILAMANAYRDGPGVILIGFKDRTPQPAEVVGIASSDHLDDAMLQQFVGSKVEPRLEFHYEERLLGDKHIAVLTIPRQARPFVLTKSYGKLEKNTGYVRRGSATDIASMSEMAQMAVADAGRSRTVRVKLRLDDDQNVLLPSHVTRSFLEFENLPDYEEDSWIDAGGGVRMRMPSYRSVNRDFYRETAEYHASRERLIVVRLSLANESPFPLGHVKLEVSCLAPSDHRADLVLTEDLPDAPLTHEPAYMRTALRGGFHRMARRRVTIDERSLNPVAHVALDTLRPGEVGHAESDLALLPGGPGDYRLIVRILADEVPMPLVEEHLLRVEGTSRTVDIDDIERLAFGTSSDETD